jgi:two-component sensor histidine kinase
MVTDSFVFGSCAYGQIFKFNVHDRSTVLFPFPIKGKDLRPYGDNKGNIWIIIDNRTLLRFDTKQTNYTVHTFSAPIESFNLNKDKEATVFLSNQAFLITIKNDSMNLKPFSNAMAMKGTLKIAASDNQCIWSIGNENQLNCFLNNSKKTITNATIGNALSIVTTVFIDQAGTLWIATDGNGLLKAKVQEQLFNSYNIAAQRAKSKNFIKCLIEGPDHGIYVGTFDQGVIKYSPNLSSYEPVKVFDDDAIIPINSLLFDKEENLWIATDKHIKILLKNGKQLIINEPFCKGLLLWNNTVIARGYKQLQLFESTESDNRKTLHFEQNLRYVYPLNKNELFVSFLFTGAGIYNTHTQKFTKIIRALADVKVNMLHVGANNNYFLASDDGIIQLDAHFNIIETINRKNGLPDHFVYSLLEDKNGRLWGSTNQGIFSYTPANKNIQTFGIKDGLSTLEFNSNAYLIDDNGKFYFGGIKGFNTINANQLKINNQTVPVYLNGIKNNDNPLPLNQHLQLKSNQNDLFVEFALPDLLTKKRNKLAIFLKGLHKEWYYLNYKRSIKFESLPPGKYTLLAKSINSNGMESETFKLTTFKIDYPFWKNPYYMAGFSILVIAFFSLITLLIVRSRHTAKIAVLQKKNEIENIRKNIYRDLHDEIGAGLSRIKILSDIALIEKDHNEHSLELVKDSATEITEKLREIVWSMNQENENLNKLAQKLQTIAEDQFTNLDIQLALSVDPTVPEIELPPIKIRNILMVYRELLNNTIKHSQAKKVTINIQYKEPILSIQIADNGIGHPRQFQKQQWIKNYSGQNE